MATERTRDQRDTPPAQGVTPGQRAPRTPHAPGWDDDLEEIPTRLTP